MDAQLTYLAYHADAAVTPASSSSTARAPRGLVRLRQFTRRFGNNTVIDKLDLDIAPGEFVALLGHLGCDVPEGEELSAVDVGASIVPFPQEAQA